MPNRLLQNVKRVILQAGHGGGDPGTKENGTTENTETNQIVSRVARILRFNGIDTVIDPDLSLAQAIQYVNQHYKFGSEWVLEIHKDSASIDPNQLRDRIGVYYYGGSADSQAIADQMAASFRANDANRLSWSRPDTAGRFGRLGWIRDTIPLAHLIECGFIQDYIDDAADEKYARWVAQAVVEALGKTYRYDLGQPAAQPQPQPWDTIPDFDQNTLAEYYKSLYRSNNWRGILGDINDRDKE